MADRVNVIGHLHADLADDLARIAGRFKSPKITLVVRAPHLADGDVVLTDDDLDEAIKAIRKLQSDAPQKRCPRCGSDDKETP